jgi:hypothetical protein
VAFADATDTIQPYDGSTAYINVNLLKAKNKADEKSLA